MLKNYLENAKLRLGISLTEFSTALEKGRFSIRRDLSLIFLCGANQRESVPSVRRSFLKSALEARLPHARIVYAEAVMEELAKHGKTKNLLDIEHKISHIADRVVIVLESYSSFCELGAFAHDSLRNKLIVINDSKFKSQQSFINLGPLQAIREDVNESRILWYPMNDDGVYHLDAIGAVLPALVEGVRHRVNRNEVSKSLCLPSTNGQAALFFLHDLIYLCGPITHVETIEIYKRIFGEQPFDDIKPLRGILHASNLIRPITIGRETSYLSQAPETFINFSAYEKDLLANFRRFHLKFNPRRLAHE